MRRPGTRYDLPGEGRRRGATRALFAALVVAGLTVTTAPAGGALAAPTGPGDPAAGTRGHAVIAATSASSAPAATASQLYVLEKTKLLNGRTIVLRWNPCQVTTYKVNVAAVPSGSRAAVLAEIRTAVARLSAATGITYSYKGATAEIPRTKNINSQSAELIIAVTSPAKTDLGIGGKVLGYGGYHYWQWRSTSSSGATSSGAAIGRGWVVIDRSGLMNLDPGFGRGGHRGNVMLHELAHTVGLDHVANASQLMNATLLPSSPDGYAAGDLAGLAKVGRRAGCLAVPGGVFKDLK